MGEGKKAKEERQQKQRREYEEWKEELREVAAAAGHPDAVSTNSDGYMVCTHCSKCLQCSTTAKEDFDMHLKRCWGFIFADFMASAYASAGVHNADSINCKLCGKVVQVNGDAPEHVWAAHCGTKAHAKASAAHERLKTPVTFMPSEDTEKIYGKGMHMLLKGRSLETARNLQTLGKDPSLSDDARAFILKQHHGTMGQQKMHHTGQHIENAPFWIPVQYYDFFLV